MISTVLKSSEIHARQFELFEFLRKKVFCQQLPILLAFYSPLPITVVYGISYDFAESQFFLSLFLTQFNCDHLSSILFAIYYLLHLP